MAERATTIRRAFSSGPWLNLATAGVLAAASWPFPREPIAGPLDESWQAALYLAIQHGVHFGSDFSWSYGPLGFATIPWPWYGPLTFVAFVVAGLIHVGLCFVAIAGARRVLPLWAALLAAYLAARGFTAFEPSEGLLALTLAACLALLLRDEPISRRWIVALLVAGGVLAGTAALGKLTTGAFVGLLLVATAAAFTIPLWRGPAIVAGIAGATGVILWILLGQRLGDLPSFLVNALEVVRGYSEAMGVDRTPSLHWYLPAYLVGVASVAWIGATRFAGSPSHGLRGRRSALVVVALLAGIAFWKVGAVRWGVAYAFAALLVAHLALASQGLPRPTFLLGFAVVFLPLLSALGPPLASMSPIESLRSLRAEASVALVPGRWSEAEQRNRRRLAEEFAVEPEILAALEGHAVHADPWHAGVFAGWPDLDWRPAPVPQSYAAYTSHLDRLNATFLAGAEAPDRILRAARRDGLPVEAGPLTIDGRSGWFDAPAAMVQTFCRYDEVAATARWEVLALTDRRCGPPEPISTVTLAAGSPVAIPAETRPDRLVIVRITGLASPVDALLTTAFKAPEWYVTANGVHRFRLVPGTAGDGLLVAVPASISRSPGFEFGPPWSTISVARGDEAPRTLTYEFLSVPLVAG